MKENIKVVVRFRPLNTREKKMSQKDRLITINTVKNTITLESHQFAFDSVFDENVTQQIMFDRIAKNAIDWVADGYNSTIFAYGPTSSGKTYCMFGEEKEKRGIIPRACDLLFHRINDDEKVVQATVKCSFLEIYRENVRDLLVSKKNEYIPSLRLRQHRSNGIYVQGLTEKFVYNPQDILNTIEEGAKSRSVSATALNSVSSRSHAVLTLTICQSIVDGTEITSKLHLIDLAGSENVGKSEVVGITLLEAQQINKSLSCLGNVIYALTEKGREHVPYRDSKLTYLLQDSLGGNSKTILIATASPHSSVFSETLNTLKFAQRTKEIKNIPTVNKNQSNSHLLKTIEALNAQIEELQGKYSDAKTVIDRIENTKSDCNDQIIVALNTKIEQLEKKIEWCQIEIEQEHKKVVQVKELFEKQRDLAQRTAKELYDEKVKLYSLKNKLERYKLFYDTVQDAIDNPHALLSVVKRGKLRLNVDCDKTYDVFIPSRELDSPELD
jgi:kinesin family protein 5